jgi:tRNA-2-methylthio-N6-dimethylallyladenosine synthase
MNMHDSEEIRKYLEVLGFTETNQLELSDLVVLNTCAIRENAHDKVFGYLGRCKTRKKRFNSCSWRMYGSRRRGGF